MPIVTLTSDIGDQDFLVGAIKGELLKQHSGFNIVDISHRLSPFNFPHAAYVCRNAFRHFPENSYHIILVNLFDEKPSRLLLAKYEGQIMACADNGLLTMIADDDPGVEIRSLVLSGTEQRNALYCSRIFAQAIIELENGKSFQEIGEDPGEIKIKHRLKPLIHSDSIEGQILFIDNFENVVVNISKDEFEEHRRGRKFTIEFKRDERVNKISETYADVAEGDKVAIFNSAGYLEIAMNKGNAAGLFGLQVHSEKQQQYATEYVNTRPYYQKVRVYFES